MACRFLQAKWFDLQKRFGRGSTNFAKVISAITKYGANKFDYDEVIGRRRLNVIVSLSIFLFLAKIPRGSFRRWPGNATFMDDTSNRSSKRGMDQSIA